MTIVTYTHRQTELETIACYTTVHGNMTDRQTDRQTLVGAHR